MMPATEWMAKITPYGWVPQLPMEEINWLTMAVLVAIAIALTVVGLKFYRQRDVNIV